MRAFPLPLCPASVIGHLVSVQAQDPGALLFSVWVRLPHPRPSPEQLSAQISAVAERFWAQRNTLQLATNRLRVDLSLATEQKVRSTCERHVVREMSEEKRERLLASFHEAEGHLEEILKSGKTVSSETLFNTADDILTKVNSETLSSLGNKDKDDEKNKTVRGRIRHALPVILAVKGVACRTIHHTQQLCLHPSRTWPDTQALISNTAKDLRVHEATVRCAQAYFSAYAPATEADFRYWMGIPAAQSRAAFAALNLRTIQTDLGPMQEPDSEERVDEGSNGIGMVEFRGRFDPALLAHADKSWITGHSTARKKAVWSNNADVRPVVLYHGSICGTWLVRDRAQKKKRTVVITLMQALREKDVVDSVEMLGREIAEGFFETIKIEILFDLTLNGDGKSVDFLDLLGCNVGVQSAEEKKDEVLSSRYPKRRRKIPRRLAPND